MSDHINSYVDEAGDPTLFGSKRGSCVIVGNDGCSKFFIMGKLEVADPESLAEKLTALRHAHKIVQKCQMPADDLRKPTVATLKSHSLLDD